MSILCPLIVIFAQHSIFQSAEVPHAPPRDAVICGANSALMFLVLCGADVEDDSLRTISPTDEGISLLQLRDFCDAHGCVTEVRKFPPAEINANHLPAICQTSVGAANHFCVAYRTDSQYVFVLDGTTGATHRLRRDRINDYLTGFGLFLKHPTTLAALSNVIGFTGGVWLNLITGGVFAVAVIVGSADRLQRRKQRSRLKVP